VYPPDAFGIALSGIALSGGGGGVGGVVGQEPVSPER
jgi:hypothetical protein